MLQSSFFYLKTGRCSTIQVWFLRYWEARNVRRGGELMGVDMMLFDSQVCLVPLLEFVPRFFSLLHFNVSVVFTPYYQPFLFRSLFEQKKNPWLTYSE